MKASRFNKSPNKIKIFSKKHSFKNSQNDILTHYIEQEKWSVGGKKTEEGYVKKTTDEFYQIYQEPKIDAEVKSSKENKIESTGWQKEGFGGSRRAELEE